MKFASETVVIVDKLKKSDPAFLSSKQVGGWYRLQYFWEYPYRYVHMFIYNSIFIWLEQKSSRETHNCLQQMSPHRPVLLSHQHPRHLHRHCVLLLLSLQCNSLYFRSVVFDAMQVQNPFILEKVGKKQHFFQHCCPEPWLQNSSVCSNKGTFCWRNNLLINWGQRYNQVSSQQLVLFCYFCLDFSKSCFLRSCCSRDHKDNWNTYCFGNHQCLWATCHYIHFSESPWPQD